MNPTAIELAWLAGILDGEGSIGLAKCAAPKSSTGYIITPSIQVSNRDKKIIAEVSRIFELIEAKGSYCTHTRFENDKWADEFIIHDSKHMDIIKILEAVKQYLISKTAQADIVLAYCKSRLGKHQKRTVDSKGKFVKTYDGSELKFYEKIRPLNKKGKRRLV